MIRIMLNGDDMKKISLLLLMLFSSSVMLSADNLDSQVPRKDIDIKKVILTGFSGAVLLGAGGVVMGLCAPALLIPFVLVSGRAAVITKPFIIGSIKHGATTGLVAGGLLFTGAAIAEEEQRQKEVK